jgi:hypothetical protein
MAMWMSKQCFRLGKFFQRFAKKLDMADKPIDDCYRAIFG